MKEDRIHVDFNEMIEPDLVLLSKKDMVIDSGGNKIFLEEGMKVKIYDNDLNENNEEDNLIANGTVVLNSYELWTKDAKWCCRIDTDGIYHESTKRL